MEDPRRFIWWNERVSQYVIPCDESQHTDVHILYTHAIYTRERTRTHTPHIHAHQTPHTYSLDGRRLKVSADGRLVTVTGGDRINCPRSRWRAPLVGGGVRWWIVPPLRWLQSLRMHGLGLGTADAEIHVPTTCWWKSSKWLPRVPFSKVWSRSEYSLACFANCQEFCLRGSFNCPHLF